MKPSCETLQQKHEELKDLAHAYGATLIQEGVASEAFREAGKRFWQAQKDMDKMILATRKELIKEKIPNAEFTTIHRTCNSAEEYREKIER